MRQGLRECDETITLADGRTLGFAQYGDPTGFPVLYFHGGLSCRIDATSAGPAAAAAGLRIIAPDRPGVGLSGRHQGASLLDWPRDVAGLTHQLDIEEFVVMGWSFGGAYAAACGFALPDQVTTTVLIASGIPRDWPGMSEQINGMDRVFLKLSGRSGAVDEAAFVAIRTLAKRTPNLFVKQTVSKMSDQSRNAILRDPSEFVEATVAALINPGGALDDYRTWHQPWGFDVADIAGPVKVWQGAEDELCPPQWGQRLADAIPASQLYLIPGAGHFMARDHWADIFDSIERS